MRTRRATRTRGIALAAVLSIGAVPAAAAGCGKPDSPYEPTLPSVNFAPKLVIEVDEQGLRATAGPRFDDTVRLDPLSARQGTVVEIVNTGTEEHRVRAPGLVDTGVMRAGERVTVALTKETTADTPYQLDDLASPGRSVTLTMTPRPTPG